jgi:hypothetical protein
MMAKRSPARFLAVAAILGASAVCACGDDDSGGGESTADACRDNLDNDGDGHTDCDDQDCELFVFCASADADADAEVDTDADTTSDGDTDGGADGDAEADGDAGPDEGGGPGSCTTVDDCEDGQACLGNGCVDPVDDLAAYAAAAASRPSSLFWQFQYPSLFPEREDCCFDYDGNPDNGPDNAYGDLLPVMIMLAGLDGSEFQTLSDADLEAGANTLVVDWRELPVVGAALADGDVRLSVFPAVFDPAEDWATRVAGDGTYALDPAGFGTHGAQTQFNNGQLESGVLTAGPSTFPFLMPSVPNMVLGWFTGGTVYPLQDVRIMADLMLEANGVHTVDETRGDVGDEYVVGGGRLGGVIPGTMIVASTNDNYSSCACAGVTGDVVTGTETTEAFVMECIAESFDDPIAICCSEPGVPAGCEDGTPGVDCCVDGDTCSYLPTMCDYTSLVGEMLDVDTNGNGVPDGMSVGLHFSWTGASIDGLAE